jgi:hypothetical protein
MNEFLDWMDEFAPANLSWFLFDAATVATFPARTGEEREKRVASGQRHCQARA